MRRIFLDSAVVVFTLCSVAVASAQEMVTVHVTSGRSFTAFIDERTDESTLWLRFQSPKITVHRPISWDRVFAAEYQAEAITREQLQLLVPRIKTSADDVDESADMDTTSHVAVSHERPQQGAPRVIRDLSIDAQLGNWDGDEAADGLVLRLVALDENGEPIDVTGHVVVRLLAPVRRRFHEAPTAGGQSLETIGSWTRTLGAGGNGSDGELLQLAFQSIDPELDDRVGSYGELIVKLVVPGQGVFERSVPWVRIRAFR